MYIDREILKEFPSYGYFYTIEIDEKLPLDQQKEVKKIVLETVCDITEASHSWSGDFISAKYSVFFPFDSSDGKLNITAGMKFEANIHGLNVNGKVVGVFPSQLGRVTAYVQDTDV